MATPLIIDARASLRWHQRLASDASTVFIWGLWLNLWVPVVRGLVRVPALTHVARRTAAVALASVPHLGVPHVAALAGTSGSLWLWNQLPAFQPRAPRVPSVGDYAEHFTLPAEVILAGRSASVCVVHHDEAGRLVRVEPKGA
jgi:poly-beta-1,6-N-acetyl-D-glucosamine biosynthesis protein PgaD